MKKTAFLFALPDAGNVLAKKTRQTRIPKFKFLESCQLKNFAL